MTKPLGKYKKRITVKIISFETGRLYLTNYLKVQNIAVNSTNYK